MGLREKGPMEGEQACEGAGLMEGAGLKENKPMEGVGVCKGAGL